jgi:hypothetical protein
MTEETHVRLCGVLIPIEQVRAWEGIHGGKVVTNALLASRLLKVMWRYKKAHGVYPDALRPPDEPGREFIPVQISVRVPILNVDVPSKYHAFIERPILHILGGIGHA